MKNNFSIGYADVLEHLENASTFLMSCYNCRYFEKCRGDDEEVCQNDDVLEYDMMVGENSICCLRWMPPEITTSRAIKRREKFFKE